MAVPIVLPEPEFTRRKILLMTFKAMQADAPLTTDAAEHPRNIEYVTMLRDDPAACIELVMTCLDEDRS